MPRFEHNHVGLDSAVVITQIILAAGLSSRMGRPKPLLDFDGQPLLAVLLDQCRRSRVDTVLVVLGHHRGQILEAVDFTGVQIVNNSEYRMGQTSSVQAALRAMPPETRAFLNLPADHPLVTSREIDALIDAYSREPLADTILVPAFEGREGRPALFAWAFRTAILELPPQEPVRRILQRFRDRVRRIPVANPYTMKDMDTPAEYQECLRIYRRVRAGDHDVV